MSPCILVSILSRFYGDKSMCLHTQISRNSPKLVKLSSTLLESTFNRPEITFIQHGECLPVRHNVLSVFSDH